MEGWREASPSSQSCQRSAWRPACGWVVARIKGVVWIEEWCALKSDKNVWHCQLWVASWQLETCSRMGTPSFQNVLMLAELKKRLLYLTLNSKYALLYTKQLGVPNWKVHGGMNSCLCVWTCAEWNILNRVGVGGRHCHRRAASILHGQSGSSVGGWSRWWRLWRVWGDARAGRGRTGQWTHTCTTEVMTKHMRYHFSLQLVWEF